MITLQERVHSHSPPEDWNLKKLHRVFRVRKGFKNTGMKEDNLLSLSYGRIVRKDIETAEGLLPESFETYQIVEPGNIVMRLTDLQNDKRSLRQGLVKERGIVTSAYDALEVEKGHDPRFWAYALLALDLAKYYYSLGGGVRQSIKFADFPNDWIGAPDLETQETIADFLDFEITRIDKLIVKKQRLVKLLSERQRRIIDELCTAGLTSGSTDKKESRIDWLGQVPRHWSIEKLAWHFRAEKGRNAQKYTKDYCGQNPGPFPVYSGQTANEGIMGTIDTYDYDFGDQGVLFSTTVGAKAMTVAHLKGKFSLSQNCMIIIPISRALPIRYYYFQLQPLFRKERELIPEHMQASFRVEDLHRYWIAVPPHQEAQAIAEAIDHRIASIVPIQEKTQQSVDRLRDYRAALITAAVTGQIDVTNWGKGGQTDRRMDQIEADMAKQEASA